MGDACFPACWGSCDDIDDGFGGCEGSMNASVAMEWSGVEWNGDLVWARRHLRAFNGGPLSPPKSRPPGGWLAMAWVDIYLPTCVCISTY